MWDDDKKKKETPSTSGLLGWLFGVAEKAQPTPADEAAKRKKEADERRAKEALASAIKGGQKAKPAAPKK